jgi:hypothetical protein
MTFLSSKIDTDILHYDTGIVFRENPNPRPCARHQNAGSKNTPNVVHYVTDSVFLANSTHNYVHVMGMLVQKTQPTT